MFQSWQPFPVQQKGQEHMGKEIKRQKVPSVLDRRIFNYERQGYGVLTITAKDGTYAAALEHKNGQGVMVVCVPRRNGRGWSVSDLLISSWGEFARRLSCLQELWQHIDSIRKSR